MKLTDFAFIVVVLTWCIFSNIAFQNDLLRENIYGNVMYNHILDNISEDAMRYSLDFEDYTPVIDREKLLNCITGEISTYYMGMDENYGDYLKECIKLVILTYPDGFYLAGNRKELHNMEWSERILYSEGKINSIEAKVNEIIEDTEKRYGIELLLPNTEGNGLTNTIADYQLLLVYETYPVVFKGKEYRKLLFSGAKVTYGVEFVGNS